MGYSVKEVLEFVEENDVKFIRLAFCDLFGTLKNLSILPNELKRAFETGISFDGAAILGFENAVRSDLFLVPNPDTLNILPWRPQQGRVIRFYCDIKNPDGSPYEYDSRYILKSALKRCSKMNFGCRVGVESEFYLFKTDENGESTDIPLDHGSYLDIAPIDKGENIRREICLCLEEMGIQPETSHHETGPGQNEIDFKFSDALSTADNLLTFKNVVSTISSRNGLYASFMPKPIKGKSGNGLHINLSLYRNGINLFDEEPNLTYSFMGGVIDKIKDMTLFLNSLPSSYERFGEYEAPKYITWSRENRSQLIRIPAAVGDTRRFELRSPDSCINPYLAFALIIHAGLDGIEENRTLPKAVDLDTNNITNPENYHFDKLPENIMEAIEYAKASEFIKKSIGKNVAERFIKIKEQLTKF